MANTEAAIEKLPVNEHGVQVQGSCYQITYHARRKVAVEVVPGKGTGRKRVHEQDNRYDKTMHPTKIVACNVGQMKQIDDGTFYLENE